MARREDVNKLLNNMQGATDNRSRQNSQDSSYTNNRNVDLSVYKQANVWPGGEYLLVGNSYNVDPYGVYGNADRNYGRRRRTSIAAMFDSVGNVGSGHGCVTLENVMHNPGFVEVMSRVELDCLRRMPRETLIGPAYDRYGNLIPQAFAVWRPERVHHESNRETKNEVVRDGKKQPLNVPQNRSNRNNRKVLAGAGKR